MTDKKIDRQKESLFSLPATELSISEKFVTLLSISRNEKIAQAMANKTASKYTQKKLSNEEMNALIGQLFASSNPNFSPNGEEISKLMTEDYLIKLFS